jgi:hypothetical protein
MLFFTFKKWLCESLAYFPLGLLDIISGPHFTWHLCQCHLLQVLITRMDCRELQIAKLKLKPAAYHHTRFHEFPVSCFKGWKGMDKIGQNTHLNRAWWSHKLAWFYLIFLGKRIGMYGWLIFILTILISRKNVKWSAYIFHQAEVCDYIRSESTWTSHTLMAVCYCTL